MKSNVKKENIFTQTMAGTEENLSDLLKNLISMGSKGTCVKCAQFIPCQT